MKKAMMYLLLALGITLIVVFIGGALVGVIAGFIDGYQGNNMGTTSPTSIMIYAGSVSVLLVCAILNWVFLKYRFASYTIGRIPQSKSIRWKIALGMVMAMAGAAVMYYLMMDASKNFGGGEEIKESFLWMRQHPVFSMLVLVIMEATGNLVLYAAVLRELLEWKHRPAIIIFVVAIIMGAISLLGGNPMLFLPSSLIAKLEGWAYEYTRSIIPLIIGDVAFWTVMLCLVGIPTHGWWFLVAGVLMVPGILLALNPMEPYKPID